MHAAFKFFFHYCRHQSIRFTAWLSGISPIGARQIKASVMRSISPSLLACVALTLPIIGCESSNSDSEPVTASSMPDTPRGATADTWLGKWNGPEGTFLQLVGGNGEYRITIQDLDGPATFRGIAAGNQIEFERHGIKETLHASTGAETGMKWLSDKSNCLTVRVGEGYCRD